MEKSDGKRNVDDKGRLIVPVHLRNDLEGTFVITKGVEGCLYVFSMTYWEDIKRKMDAIPFSNTKGRKARRFFCSALEECTVDKQGRVLIPVKLRQFAGLEGEAVIFKTSNYIEIWSKSKWDEQEQAVLDNPEEIAMEIEELGF